MKTVKTIETGTAALAALFLAAMTALGVEPAAPAAGGARTEITAQKLVFDYEKMNAVFDGGVVAQDAAMKIESDRLAVQMDPKTQELRTAKATGRVRITEQDRVATADEAEYNVAEGKLTLIGNATVTRGAEHLKGTKITFWRGTNRMECDRPVMVLFPEGGGSNRKGLMP